MATLLGQSATLAASTVTTFTFNSVLATGVFGPNATPCVKVLLFNNQAGAVDV